WGLGADPVVRRPLRRRVGVVIGAPVDLPEHRGDGLELTDVAQHILDAVRALRPEAERLARSG
ncbi:MAG TPA: hypothetical protein VM307_07415, partial [Egibacteraceae bacterium]|nr:hypothetical protein [Egibacteraceae bacterium]